MVIEERDKHILNYLTPSLLIVVGIMILTIGAVGLILVNLVLPILVPDNTLANLQINLFGQILGIIGAFFIFFPLFGVKDVETRTPNIKWIVRVFGLSCLAIMLGNMIGLIIVLIFESLGFPVQHSYATIILTPEQLANPWNLVLFFTTVIFGAAIFEELIFRRMLIPTLEIRGMAPTAAVIASSLGFALIHVPNDILNGTLGYVITHFVTSVTIGLVLGFSYVLTRNVIFPIIIHGFINFIGFTELILFNLGNFDFLIMFGLILLLIWVVGIIIGVVIIIQLFRSTPPSWVHTLRMKSPLNILPGLAGYLIIAFGLISLQVILELILLFVSYPNIVLYYGGLFLVDILIFILLLWTVNNTQYTKTAPELAEPRRLYDRASDVTLEPHQE